MKKTLYDYNDRHAGTVIYILGSSSHLNDLSPKELEFLKGKTTIGVNFTYEGVNDLTYAVCAHIAPAVYLFEHARKDMPIFVANTGPRKAAFAYMQDFFWDSERIIEFSSDAPAAPLPKSQSINDISLKGNTSILLLATHLAYIMGASQIVYIGFDELKNIHFWNNSPESENKMIKNIKNILKSKKYWHRPTYSKSNLRAIAHNVHAELEYVLNDCGYFNQSQIDSEKSFWGRWNGAPPAQQNVQYFSHYVRYLNSENIKTFTRSTQGVTTMAGCEKIKVINN